MKGNSTIIEHLNRALANELTAINQYFLHAKILKNWGVSKLADFVYKESIDEMWHADWLIERILFLEGVPDFKYMEKPIIASDVEGILKADFTQEDKALGTLRKAIISCEEAGDYVSRELLEKILKAEEEHMDELETHMCQIKALGIQNYLLAQSAQPN